VSALLLAAALMVAPIPSVAALRLAAVLPPSRARAPRRSWRLPAAWSASGAALAALVAALAAGLAVPPSVAVALLAGALARAAGRYAVHRREAQERDTVVEAVSALSADLRAGQQPEVALRAAAVSAQGAPAAVLAEAAATARLGGSVPAALRSATGCTEGAASTLRGLAAAWQVTESAGAPLGAVLDQVERAARRHRQHRRQVASLLAGSRATAVLLAGLPVVGLALGAAMGAQPLTVLLRTPAGQAALLVGVVLELAGLAWTDRIVRSAGAVP
jgi:tight adherence protein B